MREAGYNVKLGKEVVKVNGHDVHIGMFQFLHWTALLPLIDMKIGRAAAAKIGVA